MKLKGKNSKKIKSKDKEKKEKTLKRMEQTRVKDTERLRTKITAKLEILKSEIEKADTCIENLNIKIAEFEHLKSRISGAILALNEIITNGSDV